MKYRIIGIVLLTIIFIVSLMYLVLSPQDNSLARLQDNNIIRIGYAIETPYAYVTSDGQVTGESPEVAKFIVASLGIDHIEWIQTDFDALIPGLLDQRFDVIAAGMFITPERAESVQFSNPTFHVKPGLLVQRGNPLQLYTYEDIVRHGASVAVISHSVEETLLREAGVPDNRLVVVPDALTGETALRTGLVDSLALSSPTVNWIAINDPTHATEAITISVIANLDRTWGYGAFVFRPEDRQLIDAWNSELTTYIGSPNHIKLIAQFGFTEAELPDAMTTSMVLGYEN